MVYGASAKVFKYCLFVFNLIFFIAGCALLGIGIWLAVDQNAAFKIADAAKDLGSEGTSELDTIKTQHQVIRDTGIILIVGGAVILIIAFFGCCGAIKEWRPLLAMYAIVLLLILAIEIAAIVYAAINRDKIESDFQQGMKATLKYYNGSEANPNGMKQGWDDLMQQNQCCGMNSTADDFSQSGWRTLTGGVNFPPACCPGKPDVCPAANKYPDGCYIKFKNMLISRIGIVIGVAVAVGVVQIIGAVFALCLCKSVGNSHS